MDDFIKIKKTRVKKQPPRLRPYKRSPEFRAKVSEVARAHAAKRRAANGEMNEEELKAYMTELVRQANEKLKGTELS